jgi:hypothetical protein
MVSTGARWVTELKVKAMTAVTALVSVGIAVLNDVQSDSSLLGGVPALAQGIILAVVPTVIVFLAGWNTSHTPRTNVVAKERD